MSNLAKQSCVPCRGDDPPLRAEEIEERLQQVPEWQLEEEQGFPFLRRSFSFKNFAEALAFTSAVGELAESEGHHPRIVTEWGSVTVDWWTHKIRGLHGNDFIMAAKTDELWKDQ
ncbi:MAG: 4a-hydroxytetrahydrobiopterin dehydratase [Alkalispirochaetaceae bacterium]